jgi:hypothetical protein
MAALDQQRGSLGPGYGQYDEGNYSGFRNRSDLEDAVLGRTYELQDYGRELGGTIESQAQRGIAEAELRARQQQRLIGVDAQTARDDSGLFGARTTAPGASEAAQMSAYQTPEDLTDYAAEMAKWKESETGRLCDVGAAGQQIANVPISQLAQVSAGEYGIDPYLARGWFDQGLDAKQLARERDSESIRQYGVPYKEYQATLEQQGKDTEAQAQEMFNQDVYSRTGVAGDELAQKSGLAPEQVLGIMDDPMFTSLTDEVDAAVGDAQNALETGDEGSISEAAQNLEQTRAKIQSGYDPAIVSLVEAIYGRQWDPETYQLGF